MVHRSKKKMLTSLQPFDRVVESAIQTEVQQEQRTQNMDTKAISKAAKKLSIAENRLVRVVENEEAAITKAENKYDAKITAAKTAVTTAKDVLSKLVAEA